MSVVLYLLPLALLLGFIGLIAFIWSLKSGQYDDLEGAANRILFQDDDHPMPDKSDKNPSSSSDV
ncbi:MAG: cbb3-type cytochrome oxidase assembly protein CcoS [Rhodospirillales bacterium]|nr:cbb3-type cytochrome oxidase assembly protein CcoS [Rhodospirillales bacterium]